MSRRYFPTRRSVEAAIRRDGDNLMHAPELGGEKSVVLEAVASSVDALLWCSRELRGDKEVVLKAVAANGRALRYASAELREDKEVATAAVGSDGAALQFAGRLRGDADVVRAAVARDPSAAQYASDAVRNGLMTVAPRAAPAPKARRQPPRPTTIVAYGALLSVESARLTFPRLRDFRLVTIRDYRRCFAHPHTFLASRGLVDPKVSKRYASLSAEEADGASFVAAAFSVDLDPPQRAAFEARESEYVLVEVPVQDLDTPRLERGLMCVRSSDVELAKLHHPALRAFPTVWHIPPSSGLLPADIYLRHCLLAVQKAGTRALDSFLDDTLLADRVTSLRTYLDAGRTPGDKLPENSAGRGGAVRAEVMAACPPDDLRTRFGG